MLLMGKFTISMAMFNSFLYVYQRVLVSSNLTESLFVLRVFSPRFSHGESDGYCRTSQKSSRKIALNLHVLLEKPPKKKHSLFPAKVGGEPLPCFLWDNPNFTHVLKLETQNDPKRSKMTGLMVLTMIFTTSTMMHRRYSQYHVV